jgi:hypothetical protein
VSPETLTSHYAAEFATDVIEVLLRSMSFLQQQLSGLGKSIFHAFVSAAEIPLRVVEAVWLA